VPLFNKQALIEEGELKNAITSYALKVSFNLKKIFVIDGSKRSTKANAYFSGMGSQKRITLYDTLINDLDNDEIVAVLAHEVGHYKKKHIITNLILSIANIGVVLFVFSTIMDSQLLSQALGVQDHSFHIGFIAFGLLYAPLSMVTGVLMSMLSRKFEFQADQYAAQTYHAKPLINALKKLSKNNLSNLTPHPWYVFVNYSHPPLYQRIKNLENL
jgi:STE24 endopeptidase